MQQWLVPGGERPRPWRVPWPSAHQSVARALRLLAVALATLLTQQAPAGQAVSVESHRGADAIDVRAVAELSADVDTAWRVLTDYERYPEFIPNLHSSHVVERRGSTVLVEQSGDAVYGPLRLPLLVTYEIHEMPPSRLESRVVRGNVHSARSLFTLTASAHGVHLEYAGRIAPGLPLPAAMEQSAVESNAANRFTALVKEIERQAALERARSVESGR